MRVGTNSHWSPFLHKPRSQCLHTMFLSPRARLIGHNAPFVQVPNGLCRDDPRLRKDTRQTLKDIAKERNKICHPTVAGVSPE